MPKPGDAAPWPRARRLGLDLTRQVEAGAGAAHVARALADDLRRLAPEVELVELRAADDDTRAAWALDALIAPHGLSSLACLRPTLALAQAEALGDGFFTELERAEQAPLLSQLAEADEWVVAREDLRSPLARMLGAAVERVHCSPAPGASRLQAHALRPDVALRRRFGRARPFFFHPGGAEPAHNLELLLAALRLLLSRHPQVDFDLLLALAHTQGSGELELAIERLGLRGRVHLMGRLDDADLAAAYAACDAVVLPWLYQGLGLTAREALHLGRPLAASSALALPAGAALTFDPRRLESIAGALETLALDAVARARLARAARDAGSALAAPRLAGICLEFLERHAHRPRARAAITGVAPLLSIVTPSLDQVPFLERSLRSVLGQGLPGVEHVVRDGGSRDGTLALLRRYEGELRWISESDHGQVDAINRGLRATRGEFVGWLNSDDIYYPGALREVAAFFQAHPEVDLVYGAADHIDAHDRVLEPYPVEDWNLERLEDVCYLCQPAVFVRRRVFERFGELDERLRYCMDYEYWLRIGPHVRVARLSRRLAGSRLHPGAKTLRARVAVHAEINDMLRRRLGRVPERWLHNYAWAVVDAAGHDRARFEDYAVRLGLATLWAFLRWERRLPRHVLRTASGFMRRALRPRA